jgi:hypothetical protein
VASRFPRNSEFLELLPEVDVLDMTLLPQSSLPLYYLNSEDVSNSKLLMCPPSSVPSGVAALE